MSIERETETDFLITVLIVRPMLKREQTAVVTQIAAIQCSAQGCSSEQCFHGNESVGSLVTIINAYYCNILYSIIRASPFYAIGANSWPHTTMLIS